MIKRVFLFAVVNILVIATIQIVYGILVAAGIIPPLSTGIGAIAIYSLIWGVAGSFISLMMSRQMAKWMMGVKIIDPMTHDHELRQLVSRVHDLSRRAGLPEMPEVGIYESPEVNAFATGPSKSRSLVAVSTGLLQRLDTDAVEGVLGHEVAHIANGDMVTMTLIQGVVNAFVIFFSRIIATVIGQNVDRDKRFIVEFASIIVLQIIFGILGSIVVNYFSRRREFRADAGGARLAGRDKMVRALQALQNTLPTVQKDEKGFATLKISDRGGMLKLFSTHPSLESRIARLQSAAY